MVSIIRGGFLKRNTISLSMELPMIYRNKNWGPYIWIQNVGSGDNGIKHLMEATLLEPGLCRSFMLILKVTITIWDD
jgi:hypothetical protein